MLGLRPLFSLRDDVAYEHLVGHRQREVISPHRDRNVAATAGYRKAPLGSRRGDLAALMAGVGCGVPLC